jgi:GNAT superfamily N-acetyltransferase
MSGTAESAVRRYPSTVVAMSKRSFMRAALAPLKPTEGLEVRSFEAGDTQALGALMYRAYLDTVDYEGETPEQAAAEVAKTIKGEYGTFLPSCSKVFARSRSLLSATLVTRFQDRPFVAFTFTEPESAGQGLARACMQSAMNELFAQGERELRLVVTLANTPAVKLYTRLGFEFERE